MSNETKQDVFNALMADMSHGSEQWRARYDAAFPDNLPVIPKAVGEYLKRYKLMFTLFGFLRDAVSRIDTPLDDLNQTKYHWIANNQNTFARAWVLGVWRVEETGEIVKAEEEK
ncbi:DUF1642 domain-containing protein [Lacticaseibacillus paracasei]|uniref:DUF1642 domain-containing protein n=1 Tax=Lacticaseibacillus paracasei TaxID=1597 RepID=UPI001BABB18A|nr:DUF1642 domain-containing protein [Lacticaseibacillus paracasei]MBS0990522.1 DUF1642 domain-containing protein [Lacticaseibacillus paracasei]